MQLPECLRDALDIVDLSIPSQRASRVRRYVNRLFATTLFERNDGLLFVVTGDIPAMWIRDSTWQMLPLLDLTHDQELCNIIGKVSRQQAEFLLIDPYANAFNSEASGNCWHKDFSDQSPWVFERKFELDSWSTFFELALSLHEETSFVEHLDAQFWQVAELIVRLCKQEQHHDVKSYRFVRSNADAHDFLSHNGYGAPIGYTGLVWSGFRPSDDRCVLGYHIPSNAHLAVVLRRLVPVAQEFGHEELAKSSLEVANDISSAINELLRVHGRYPYEVDGLGNAIFMDDPNFPSLLSLPELGWCSSAQPEYVTTRDWIHSSEHKYFAHVNGFFGLTSDHTPPGYVWPLSIAMRGLTSSSHAEATGCLDMLEKSDGGTGDMHESFNCEQPEEFTRSWFSWADMTYVRLVIDTYKDEITAHPK